MRRRLLSATTAAVAVLLAATTLPAHAQPPGGGPGGDPPPDVTGPVITVTAPPAAWEGWYAEAVDVSTRATDPSGIDTFGYTLSGAHTGEGSFELAAGTVRIANAGVTTITFHATDSEGNSSSRSYNVGIDLWYPTIEVGGVTDGSRIVQHSTPAFTFGCADLPTGIVSCFSDPAYTSGDPLYSATLGEHTVSVTAVDRVGRSRVRRITYTVVQPDLQIQHPPQVSGLDGTPRVGDQLHAHGAAFVPAAESLTYRWVRGGTVVATGPDYTVTGDDLGHELGVQVTGSRTGYNDRTWGNLWLGTVTKGAFEVTGVGRLLGTPAEGKVLTVRPPTSVTPTPTTTTYEWTIGTRTVLTKVPSLTLTSAMVGQQVSAVIRYGSATHADVRVPVTLSGVPGTATRTARVTGKAWTVLRRAAVQGTPSAGRTLTAVVPRLNGRVSRFSYQWLRDGKVIRGATGLRYRARAGDRRHLISVRVRAYTPYRPFTYSTSAPVRIR